MNMRAWLWAFLGVPGLREIALLAVVVLVLYGRSGVQVARRGGGLLPWWLSPVRRTPASAVRARRHGPTPSPAATAASWRRDRLFWFLALIAATAVGAWIVTRTLIVAAPKL
jgi:hypothetical protein